MQLKLGLGYKVEIFKADTLLWRSQKANKFHIKLLRLTETGTGSEGQNSQNLLRPTETLKGSEGQISHEAIKADRN
jgi:hypothetical protein